MAEEGTAVAEETKQEFSKVEKAFGPMKEIKLESGRRLVINKWSVRKLSRMSKTIADLVKKAMGLVKDKGIQEGEEGETSIEIEVFFEAIASLIDDAVEDFAFIVSHSILDGDSMKELSTDEVLDGFTAEDFVDTVNAIIELNITENLVKKIKGLLQGNPFMKKRRGRPPKKMVE